MFPRFTLTFWGGVKASSKFSGKCRKYGKNRGKRSALAIRTTGPAYDFIKGEGRGVKGVDQSVGENGETS